LIKRERWGLLCKMKNSSPGFFFFFLLFISCTGSDQVKTSRYYDLETFFKEKAEHLQQGGYKLEKKLVKDSYSETRLIDSVNWKKMLSPFISCDINKPSWINSYAADSSHSGDSSKVTYQAKEAYLPIRRIELLFINNSLEDVIIKKKTQNFYYSLSEIYNYHSDGFVIRSSQKIRLMKGEQYEITGRFVR
jgi:hypothetical protein